MALFVIEGLECVELAVGDGAVESLWIRIKGQKSNVGTIVRVFYRLPSQDNDVNKLFYEELRDTPKSTALVLRGDFNLQKSSGSITQLVQSRPEDPK